MGQVHTILVTALLLGGCATKAMREHAGVMVHAGEWSVQQEIADRLLGGAGGHLQPPGAAHRRFYSPSQ